MTEAWYAVASMGYSYLCAALSALLVLTALRKLLRDRILWRRVRRDLPGIGAAGTFRVLSAGNRRLSAGQSLSVPYEGTLGAARSCDVCIPYKKVHLRSAFFWMEKDGLHMVTLHRDGFTVDDVPVEPGDEAILESGAILCVGELRMVFRTVAPSERQSPDVGPYVTSARRTRAQKGHGDGLGRPGKRERRDDA